MDKRLKINDLSINTAIFMDENFLHSSRLHRWLSYPHAFSADTFFIPFHTHDTDGSSMPSVSQSVFGSFRLKTIRDTDEAAPSSVSRDARSRKRLLIALSAAKYLNLTPGVSLVTLLA